MFSCHTRGFCPSCHANRLEEWGQWLREELLLGDLAAVQALLKYFQATTGTELLPGVVACIQTFGDRINLHPHVHCLVREERMSKDGSIMSRALMII